MFFFRNKPYWVQWDLLPSTCALHGRLNLLLSQRNAACSFTGHKHLHCPSKPYHFDLLNRVFQQCLLAMEKQISRSSFIFLPYTSTLTLGKLGGQKLSGGDGSHAAPEKVSDWGSLLGKEVLTAKSCCRHCSRTERKAVVGPGINLANTGTWEVWREGSLPFSTANRLQLEALAVVNQPFNWQGKFPVGYAPLPTLISKQCFWEARAVSMLSPWSGEARTLSNCTWIQKLQGLEQEVFCNPSLELNDWACSRDGARTWIKMKQGGKCGSVDQPWAGGKIPGMDIRTGWSRGFMLPALHIPCGRASLA